MPQSRAGWTSVSTHSTKLDPRDGRVLVARLKPGWRYDAKRRCFCSSKQQARNFRDSLPPRTRIRPLIPELAQKDPGQLSRDEKRLARTLHLVFPSGSTATKYLDCVEEWEWVDEAWLPPSLSPA